MILSDIIELNIITVYNRGIPNEECIAIQVNQQINLGQYGIMIGQYTENNSAIPFKDNMFWFGDGIVQEGDWLFIFTGNGHATQYKSSDGIHNSYNLFWERPHTIFANSNVVPILFRVDAVNVNTPPNNLPQLSN